MTSEPGSTTTSKQTSQPFSVPVAIVIAGALIAAAVYFGGGKVGSSSNEIAGPANTGNTGNNAAAPTQPAEPTVGEIRAVTAQDHVRGAANAKVTVVE